MSVVRNWAETFSSRPRVLREIDTVEELTTGLDAARAAGAGVRVLGAAQSPSDIAMSEEHLLRIRGLNRVRAVDRDRCEVMAEAGISLGALAEALGKEGLALPNLSSIVRQTLGGAIATGTHGTGIDWGSISTWVEGFEMLAVDGSAIEADAVKNAAVWSAGRLSLGALGVQTAFRLKVVPEFDLRVEEGPVRLEDAMATAWSAGADYARVWYLPYVDHAWGWRAWRVPHERRPEAVRKSSSRRWWRDRVLGYYGFQAGLWLSGSMPSLLPEVNRAYSGLYFSNTKTSVGASVEQFTFDCLFQQRVTEWAVPLDNALQAVLGVREMVDRQGFRAHLPIEIRFTAGDDIPLSPTFGGARCWIGIVSYLPWKRELDWQPWFAAFEASMLGFNGRPHWAKQFNVGAEKLRELYPKWNEFQAIRRRLDPDRRLRNAYTERVLGA